MTAKKLSILVPTTASRRAFWPWLGWNIQKQQGLDWASTEVVFACEDASVVLSTPGIVSRCVTVPAAATIGAKRNELLEAASGEYIAWFDDDDWHHPSRLAAALRVLEQPQLDGVMDTHRHYLKIAGEQRELRLQRDQDEGAAISFVGRRLAARGERFHEFRLFGEDTRWALGLVYNGDAVIKTTDELVRGPSFAGLYHGQNTTSKILSRWRWKLPWGQLAAEVGPEAWGDTDTQVRQLKERLGCAG